MSSAEELATQFESGDADVAPTGGKRTKAGQADHKHDHPEGDTRRIVTNAINGENKRKDAPTKQ
jgi:hypothetical protein